MQLTGCRNIAIKKNTKYWVKKKKLKNLFSAMLFGDPELLLYRGQ